MFQDSEESFWIELKYLPHLIIILRESDHFSLLLRADVRTEMETIKTSVTLLRAQRQRGGKAPFKMSLNHSDIATAPANSPKPTPSHNPDLTRWDVNISMTLHFHFQTSLPKHPLNIISSLEVHTSYLYQTIPILVVTVHWPASPAPLSTDPRWWCQLLFYGSSHKEAWALEGDLHSQPVSSMSYLEDLGPPWEASASHL